MMNPVSCYTELFGIWFMPFVTEDRDRFVHSPSIPYKESGNLLQITQPQIMLLPFHIILSIFPLFLVFNLAEGILKT